MKEANMIWIFRAILASLSFVLLLWLFWQNLVPTGILVLRYKKSSPTSPITDLHPEKRIINLDNDKNSQYFYIDPVYFDAKVPREFNNVIVEITWQNKSQPILELGARKFRGSWSFVLKPLQNKIIDKVLSQKNNLNWDCQRYDKVIFCQKKKKYSNLTSFFSNPSGKVLSYNYVLPKNINYDLMSVDSNIDKYDFIIATYKSPESLGNNWYRKTVKYNWDDFDLYINEISFLISAPKLNTGYGQIAIGNIIITLKRNSLDWKGFVQYAKNQVKRFK